MNDILQKFHFVHFDEIDSTNNYVKKNYETLPNLTVVTADKQTAGRGRLGRSFYSPEGVGAYFTLLIKDDISSEILNRLTVMAAVAVMEEMKCHIDRNVAVKWVNDIYIDGKKVCGILAESSVNPKNKTVNYALVGIGINVFSPKDGYPADLCNKITALFNQNSENAVKEKIISGVICRLYKMLSGKDSSFVDRYRQNSYLDGRKVDVISADTAESATALFVDENCNLTVKFDKTGEIKTLFTGEVSIKII